MGRKMYLNRPFYEAELMMAGRVTRSRGKERQFSGLEIRPGNLGKPALYSICFSVRD
jgi:hypothetical protein